MNAQAVWGNYSSYMETSTQAELVIEELMSSLTSIRLDSNYRGSTQDFVLGWIDKVRQYESLTPIPEHFPDTLKKSMLQNSLSGVRVFKDLKIQRILKLPRVNHPSLIGNMSHWFRE